MVGLLNIAKPIGPTSFDVVASVRRAARRGVKVGHAGTLDPFAAGVLVVCVGPATRLADFVQQRPKRYRATVRFGATSTTDDPEGDVAPAPDTRPATEEDLRAVLPQFIGRIEQVPPAHSAVHIDGQRAYKLARAGETLDLPARPVEVYALELLEYAWPNAVLDVHCGAGTYIRSLARDIGRKLGVGGYCQSLTRTAVGPFTLDDAVAPGELDFGRDLQPAGMLFTDAPRATLDKVQIDIIRRGRALDAARVPLDGPAPGDGPIALLDETGQLIALAERAEAGAAIRPRKVFA